MAKAAGIGKRLGGDSSQETKELFEKQSALLSSTKKKVSTLNRQIQTEVSKLFNSDYDRLKKLRTKDSGYQQQIDRLENEIASFIDGNVADSVRFF